jgi:hypothetical protein
VDGSTGVTLPETIPAKYTEEEAEYLNLRPVVRQTFRIDELLDMVLGVTGKDVARIQQILRAGTVVFHSYRYWWQGFEAGADELSDILKNFPDPDPSRPFRAEACNAVLLEFGGAPQRRPMELGHDAVSRKRFLRSRSFWDCLMELARAHTVAYLDYSYGLHADLYGLEMSPSLRETLERAAEKLAPRDLRARLRVLPAITRIVFVCPRQK